MFKKIVVSVLVLISITEMFSQVTPNINSGNPNFPFPQFKDYNNGKLKTLSHYNHQPAGMTHAEMELRIREAYKILSNNMTYNIDQNGTLAPLTVNGVRYIMPNKTAGNDHCTCVEGDGYYLLAAAYMGDKATFDGYFMWAHDRQFQNTTRFVDNVVNSPNYPYSSGISGAGDKGVSLNVFGGGLDKNSAGDGDVDLAMALLVAWKQWGDNGVICNDPELGSITYKEEALKYFRAMVDIVPYAGSSNPVQMNSGIIGFDGYMKGGDSWNELTNWATVGNPGYDASRHPQRSGNEKQHIDYYAPSYFNSIAKILENEGDTPWRINQFKRAEASSDWLMGQMAVQNLISYAGWVEYNDAGSPVYSKYDNGEDFRAGWRTVLNYVWNGNPTTSWNPVTHQVVNTPNTYEYNIGINTAKFLKDPQSFGVKQYSTNSLPMNICGISTLRAGHLPSGLEDGEFYRLNWPYATLSPSAITAQDFETMAKMYRKCEISWTAKGDGGQKYLDSNPVYFHEWFRLLGMLLMSGNYHDPLDFAPAPNLKVYKKVDKTFAYVGDTITYTLNFRNYGKGSATNVSIKDTLPSGLSFLSQKTGKYNATFSNSNGILTWNYTTVSGTDGKLPNNLNDTRDSIVLKVLVKNTALGRLCNTSSIFENGTFHWKSNEFPNNVSEIMERNCVDILVDRPLTIKKTASRKLVQVGDTLSYTIVVKNKSVGFLNGGRPGVHFSFAVDGLKASANNQKQSAKIFHGAEEAYINLQNYRYSYFMKEPIVPNWIIVNEYGQGVGSQGASVQTQILTPGEGYNHRIIVRFPNIISTVFQHLVEYGGPSAGTSEIHRGETAFPWLQSRFETNPNGNFNFSDDWSADPNFVVGEINVQNPFTLITNDWTNPNNPNIPVTKLHPDACDIYTKRSNKILVEEFDGYTWRRIHGSSPVEGRELLNVNVIDSLSNGVVFGGFSAGYPSGTVAGNKITWPTISQMLVNDSIVYHFWVTVKDASFFGCPGTPNPTIIINKAKVSADNEGTVSDTAVTLLSCDEVFIPLKNFTKTADKANYQLDDEITYTIGWKNKSGSIVKSIGAVSDWSQVTGNPFIFNATSLLINGVGPNGATGNNVMVHKYSHGNNGSIKATFSLISDQEQYALIFRQNGNKWYEIRFKKFYNGIEVSVWDFGYTTNGIFTELLPGQLNPSNAAFVDVRIDLLDKKLSFSLVNSGNLMPSAGQYTFLDLQDVVGYAGWRSNNNSSATVSAWYTNLDSSFDVQLLDPIPSDVAFVSASDASVSNCSSCGSTTLAGRNVANVVTYPILKGPISYNDSITFVWKGKLATCPTNQKIVNTASMKILGVSPDITAQVISTCGTAPVCVKPDSVTVKDTLLVAGGTTTLRAVVIPAKAGYIYNWYRVRNNTTQLLQTGADVNTYVTSDTGRYVVRVADLDTADAQCYRPSNIASVTFGCSAPPAVTVNDASLEMGGTTTLTASFTPDRTGYIYSWYKLPNTTTPLAGSGVDKKTLTVSDTGRYIVRVADRDTVNANCFTLSNRATVVYGCTPPLASIVETSPADYCANTRGTTLTAQAVPGMDYQWFKGATPVGTNTTTLANADSGTYTVRVGKGTCTSVSNPVKVVITPQPLAEIDTVASKLKYCVGDMGELVAHDAGVGATYWWLLEGIPQGAASSSPTYTPTTALASTSSWQVLTTLNGCSDTSAAVVMTEVQAYATDIEVVADKQEACIGTEVNVNVTTKTEGTIEWYQNGVLQPLVTGNLYTFTFAQDTKIKAVLSTTASCADPKIDSSVVQINLNTVEAAIDLLIDKTLPICEGQTLVFTAKTTSGVASTLYEWTVDDQVQQAVDTVFTSSTLKNGQIIKVVTTDACSPAKQIQDTMTVRLLPAVSPTLTLKPVAGLVCGGQSVTFKVGQQVGQGSSPTYTWYVNGGISSTGSADSLRIPIAAKTEVYAKLASSEECAAPTSVDSDVLTVDITQAIAPTVSIVQIPNQCPGETSTAFNVTDKQGEGNNPLYKWYVNGNLLQSGSEETFTTDALAQGYEVVAVLLSDLECSTVDSAISNSILYALPEQLQIQLYKNVNGQYATGLCKGQLASFEVISNNDFATYEWYVSGVLQTGQNSSVFSTNSLVNGDSIRVKAVLPNCPALNVQDAMTVTVDDKPLEGFSYGSGTVFFCPGQDTLISALETNPNYTYTWKKGSITVSTTSIVTITEAGGYTLEIKNGGCSVRSELRAQYPTLGVKATADPVEFVPGEAVKVNAVVDNPFAKTISYQWSPISLVQPSDQQQATLYPQETMFVKIVVSTLEGCWAQDSIQLRKVDKLFIPNAITPETGDINAFWNIKGAEAYPEIEVKVYNRWGSLVHEQRGYATAWDGKLNGKQLPTGTYYYVLKDKKFSQPMVGDLTIVY